MTNTRRLSTIAILSAISFVLMYFDFPLLPAASFLKIEFSILPVLVGLVVMDLPAALGILLLRSLLKLLLNLSLIHISEPTRPRFGSRMPSSA